MLQIQGVHSHRDAFDTSWLDAIEYRQELGMNYSLLFVLQPCTSIPHLQHIRMHGRVEASLWVLVQAALLALPCLSWLALLQPASLACLNSCMAHALLHHTVYLPSLADLDLMLVISLLIALTLLPTNRSTPLPFCSIISICLYSIVHGTGGGHQQA